jgi:hypothetical protein
VATLWVFDYAAGEYNAALAIWFTEEERAQGRVLGVHYDEQQTLLIRRVLKQIPQHWKQAPKRHSDTESFRYMADRLLRHKLHGSLRYGYVASKLGHLFVVFGEREDMIRIPFRKPTPSRLRVQARAHIPEDVRWEVWERDGFSCVHCHKRRFLTLDHIIPVSKGGSDDPSNLQTLCRTCNSRKGARDEETLGLV